MPNKTIQIIAEAGVNHNGSLQTAIKLVDEAILCGADVIKFQTFKAEKLVSKASPKASYQLKVTDSKESQLEMLKKIELTNRDFKDIFNYCLKKKIEFMSTPYSFDDVDFLDSLGVKSFKVASGQLTEIPFLKYIAKFGKRMILSTGMATLSEIFSAVSAIRDVGNNDIVVLQCTTNYPSKNCDANIRAMQTIKHSCQVEIGYSDHVEENYAAYAAVALGASVIEKHFTLDKSMVGPDHSCSLTPVEFKNFVHGIKCTQEALGSPLKEPSSIELQNAYGMKRSLVASRNIKTGEKLTRSDFEFKRPANGLSVNMIDEIIGKSVLKDVAVDEPFQMNSIAW